MKPVQFDGYGEKFKDVLDEFLVTSICGHFGVMPTEIGFTPKTGLGGAGHQSGEASSSEVIGLIPLSEWVGRMLSQISHTWLGMPRELEFSFQPSKRQDAEATARARDIDLRNAGITINESRAERGLPLLDTPAADQPLFVTSSATYAVTDEGLVDVAMGNSIPATPEVAPAAAESVEPAQAAEPVEPVEAAPATEPDETAKAAMTETRAFMRWLRKSPSRPFEFKHLPAAAADTLNKFVEVEDYEGARWYAERYLA